MLNTKQSLVTTRMKCIDLGTLDHFITVNKDFIRTVLEKNNVHTYEIGYCTFYLSPNGKLHLDQFPYTKIGEQLGKIESLNIKFSGDIDCTINQALCFIYNEYQRLIREQSCTNNNVIKAALNNNGQQMFTPIAYANFITNKLDKIDTVNDVNIAYLVATKEYGLDKLIIKLNSLKKINLTLYEILLSYAIAYHNANNTDDTIAYYILVKKLQKTILKPDNLIALFYNGFGLGSYYCNILIKISQDINQDNKVILPLSALTFYDTIDAYGFYETIDDHSKIKFDNVFYTMQNQADYDLFIKNTRITDVGFLSINHFLQHSNAKIQLKGNKVALIKQLKNKLRQRGAELDEINKLINFIS